MPCANFSIAMAHHCILAATSFTWSPAADTFLSVEASDHIMVEYRRLPVRVALAGLTVRLLKKKRKDNDFAAIARPYGHRQL